jgi:hypothetical protein
MISSYVGENKEFERQYLAGELELGSRRRGRWPKLRAGGAGIPSTKTGYGGRRGEKPVAEFDGQNYILERSLKADLALVKAWEGDKSEPHLPDDGAQLQSQRSHRRRVTIAGSATGRDGRARSRPDPRPASSCSASSSTRRRRNASSSGR